MSDYGSDGYQWTRRQAALLEDPQWDDLDVEHLIEEVRSLGTEQAHAVESRLRTLLAHLVKWRHQPVRRSPSWRGSVGNARDEIDDRLARHPSLRGEVPGYVARQDTKARRRAADETGRPLATSPASGRWAVERLLDEGFWPEKGGEDAV